MRKIFLILSLCLFAFVGQIKADEVQIGRISSSNTSQYLPISPYYNYSLSQQIYTAAEIGMPGTINSISFNINTPTSGGVTNRACKVYMANVEKTAFSSRTDWESLTSSDMVFDGTVTPTSSGWLTITLDTPFEYDGTSNLLVCVVDNTGYHTSYAYFSTFRGTGNQALYYKTDSGSGLDATSINSTGKTNGFKNVIKLDITAPTVAAELEVSPVDLGYRPNNAWTKPVKLTLSSTGAPFSVNALDIDNNYFTLENVNVPFITPNTINVATGNANAGVVEGTLTVLYNETERTAKQFNITANAYDPATSDVWETAKVVSTMSFAENTVSANLYNNYELPGQAADDKDAVYKVTFPQDMMLSANVNGENAKVAVYEEGFNGVGGPSVNNNYSYAGPQVGPGPIMTWFSYNYATGNNTFYGSADPDKDMFFGYRLSTEVLQSLGFGNCSLIAVESAARESYPYDLYVFRGDAQPEELIYAQEMGHDAEAYTFFHMDIDEPFVLGDEENIWVMFHSNSPYAAYCGKYPTSAEGQIYYSFGGQTWYSNDNYTPVIYIQLAELPTGRQITANLAELSTTSIAAEAYEAKDNAAIKGTSKAIEYLSMIEERENANNARNYGVENMYVPAGTYYIAMSSSTENFGVEINAEVAPTPVAAQIVAPSMGETNVTSPLLLQWVIGNYTTEMQVLFGSQYPPEDVLIDWTDELVESAIVANLEHNRTYFIQVNERNTSGVSSSEIVGFTTVIDGPENLVVENNNLYPGEAAVLSWEMNRSFRGYNVYVDGEKYNAQPITSVPYNVEGLEYNVEQGHAIYVTAVYDEGESLPTNTVIVNMTGNGSVSGKVYELEPTTLMEGATVTFNGVDEYSAEQTFTFTTDANGEYSGELLAGIYDVTASLAGYADITVSNVEIVYNQLTENVDINIHEFYKPVGQVVAELNEDETVANVTWSWDPAELFVDFETGDFSQANFDNTGSAHPWVVTTTSPYEGTYCMKSTCEGINSGESYIDAIVDVPYDAKVGFYVRTSSETSFDKFYFYIDGVQQGEALSGLSSSYLYREYNVTEGTHTYRWKYLKDSSLNSGDDCIYVDNITLYRKDNPTPPIPGGQTFDFEDGTLMGWTCIDADGDGNVWQNGSSSGLGGHDGSAGMLFSQSYINQVGALTPDNYLVSPTKMTVQDGAVISFWAAAQDAGYPAEHYGVAVSTASNTNANDFTTIWEETMTAKRAATVDAYAKSEIRGTRAQGLWYQKTIDLSAYAGQEIWVAIRHFNCTDCFYLDVDDITLADGSAKSTAATRAFQNFNVYRRNVLSDDEPVLLAMTTEMEMADNTFATVEAGSYQYGVAASYEGYIAPEGDRAVAETYTYGFEGTFEGWTSINADGDNYDWTITSTIMAPGYPAPCHSGSDCVESASYFQGTLTPDNYLVSPAKAQYSQISFWAAAYKTDFPAEHYGVAVSTTGNTDPNDFTTIWEETMTAKGSTTGAKREMNGSKEVGTWYQKTIDLSAYAGQEIWVAIRHFNCTDQWMLLVDDVELTAGGALPPTPPTPPTSQALIDEDFEDGLPTDWSMEDTGNAWYVDGEYTGEGALAARVDYNYTGAMSMKFVTPAVDLTEATGATLTFLGHQHTQGVGTTVYGPDPLTVYYRVNNGEWIELTTFTDGQQDYAVFAERSVTLPEAALSASTQLAFAIGSNEGYGAIIDNVVLTASVAPSVGNESEILWSNAVDKDMFTTVTVSVVANNGQSVEGATVEFVNNVEDYTYTATLDATGTVTFDDFRKGEYTYTVALDGYTSSATGAVISIWEEMTINCELEENITAVEDLYVSTTGWAKWVGPMPSNEPNPGPNPPTPPTPGEGEWYYYDDGTCLDAIGTGGGQFSWGVMFPAGSYEGNMVTKVAAWDYMAMTGTVTVYNGGTTAPGTAVGTTNVSFAGTQSSFSEFEFAEPIVVDPSQNLWIIFYNASGATHPAACSTDVTGDPNGRWVSIDGIDWMDLASAGISGYTFMVRAYVAEGAKGEVKEISVNNTYDGGTLAKAGRTSNRAMWDMMKAFNCTSAGQQGVATDGEFIYTASWQGTPTGGYTFYKYDLEGNFVEGFNIPGAVGVRDMTTDGEYFYATSGGNEIFVLDLANKTKVGSIYGAGLTSRHISYDPERDAFWCGNWSDLALYDRSGAVLQSAPSPSSAYGSGYFKDSDGVEHLYLFCQPNSDAKVYDYNITNGTLGSSPVFDFASTPGAAGGISGGAFVGAYNGKTCFFGNVQTDPNVVGIYELSEGAPVPPTPIAGILGAMVFVDGELITAEPINNTSISISNIELGEHELCVRVVYADSLYYAMSCPTCAEIETVCTPVKDLEGQYVYENGIYGAQLTWACDAEPISYKVYRNDMLVAEVSEMEFVDELTNTPGNYTYGVVAVYSNCESDMVTVNVNVTNVNENEVVNAIYPNPTNGDLNIYAAAMERISIINAMGQMVYDQAVNGDSKVIDMSQFEAGVYMVNVVTENGTSVKRVTVIK